MAILKAMKVRETTIENVRIIQFLTGNNAADIIDKLVASELDRVREEKKDKLDDILATRTEEKNEVKKEVKKTNKKKGNQP